MRSSVRIAADPEFRYIIEDLDAAKKRVADNKVSLNEKARRAEIEQDKVRKETRTAAREKIKHPDAKVYAVTLDNVTKPELQLATAEKTEKPEKPASTGNTKEPKAEVKTTPAAADDEDAADDEIESETKTVGVDPIKDETLNILRDLIDLTRAPKSATASTGK